MTKRAGQSIDALTFGEMVRELGEDAARARWKLSDQYGDLFDQLVQIMARHDPVGLMRDGSPEDEYTPEARPILLGLDLVTSEEDLRKVIEEVFDRCVGPHMIPGTSAAIAKDSWPLVRGYL